MTGKVFLSMFQDITICLTTSAVNGWVVTKITKEGGTHKETLQQGLQNSETLHAKLHVSRVSL